jgi:hypothetical protein
VLFLLYFFLNCLIIFQKKFEIFGRGRLKTKLMGLSFEWKVLSFVGRKTLMDPKGARAKEPP